MKKPLNPMERLKDPHIRSWMILALIIHLFHCFLLLGMNAEIPAMLILILFLPGIFLGWSIAPIMTVLLTVVSLLTASMYVQIDLLELILRPRRLESLRRVPLTLEQVAVCLSVLMCLMTQFRIRSMAEAVIPAKLNEDTSKQAVFEPAQIRLPATTTNLNSDLFTGLILCLVGFVLGLFFWGLFLLLDRGFDWATNLRMPRATARVALFAFLGINLLLVLSLVRTRYRFGRLTEQEAEMFLREEFQSGAGREVERIYRWKRWYQGQE